MYEILWQFESFTFFSWQVPALVIFTHGLLSAVGFLLAVAVFLNTAQKNQFHLEFIADHYLAFLLSALISARAFAVFLEWEKFSGNWWNIFMVFDGGVLMWGGILGFLFCLAFFCWKQKEPFAAWVYALFPATCIAFIFDAIGAFLGGSYFGYPTDLPWGVQFSTPQIPYTVNIHPVQIYHLIAVMASYGVFLLITPPHMRAEKKGWYALLLFCLGQFIVEFWRADREWTLWVLRYSQFIQLLLIVLAVYALLKSNNRSLS